MRRSPFGQHGPGTNRWALRLSAVLVLAAAGCGSDSASDDGTTPVASEPAGTTPDVTTPGAGSTDPGTTPDAGTADTGTIPADLTTGQGVTDTEITIGVIIDDSGPFAAFSPGIRATMNARISMANDAGGVAGRQLKTIYYDSKSDPAQDLILTKRLWEQDKVFNIITFDLSGPPLDYATEKQIPVFSFAGGFALFSSKYPTVVPFNAGVPSHNAHAAYAVVNYQDKHPKNVAVSIWPYEEPLKFWIEGYWKQLGAEKVTIDIGVDPTADCSALVLKYQADEIDFWDFHDNSWLACIPAQLNAGWHPQLGQGGPSTSEVATASLIGKPMADLGVLAGAPTTLANGKPVYETTPPENQEYIDAMKKYAPEFATDRWLNDPITSLMWGAPSTVITAIIGAAKTGELSPETLNAWLLQAKNVPWMGANPMVSLAGDCKTGIDNTIWGTWQWDDAKQELYMEPFAPLAGEPLITSTWYEPDPCYLTRLADEYYVN